MAELSVDTVMLTAKDLLRGCHSFVTITWGVVHIEDYLTLIICASFLPPPPKSIRQCVQENQIGEAALENCREQCDNAVRTVERPAG